MAQARRSELGPKAAIHVSYGYRTDNAEPDGTFSNPDQLDEGPHVT